MCMNNVKVSLNMKKKLVKQKKKTLKTGEMLCDNQNI